MRRAFALVCAVLAGVALGGCGALRSFESAGAEPWVRTSGVMPVSDAESLLMYFSYLKRLPAAELASEHDTARQAFTRSRSDFSRVRLALALSLPNTGFHDESRALDLLEPVAKNRNAALYDLAILLSAYLQEQRRREASAQGLQRKLDALKSLEKTLIERDRGATPRK